MNRHERRRREALSRRATHLAVSMKNNEVTGFDLSDKDGNIIEKGILTRVIPREDATPAELELIEAGRVSLISDIMSRLHEHDMLGRATICNSLPFSLYDKDGFKAFFATYRWVPAHGTREGTASLEVYVSSRESDTREIYRQLDAEIVAEHPAGADWGERIFANSRNRRV